MFNSQDFPFSSKRTHIDDDEWVDKLVVMVNFSKTDANEYEFIFKCIYVQLNNNNI